MKKIKMIILTILLCIPMMVKADMGAPMSTYEARISNVNGADIYEYNENSGKYEKTDKKLNYDEVYYIQYEQIINNELFGVAVTKNEKGQFEGYYDIKLSDIKPIEVKLEDYKNETKAKYYVFDNSNYLYKGPSTLYGKVEPEIALEVGTTIEVEYYDDLWAYVEHKGVKGWVYIYTYRISEPAGMAQIFDDRTYEIRTVKDVKLYSSPKEDKELGITIPSGTNLNPMYVYYMSVREPNYYVDYNGVKGWIKAEFNRTIFYNEQLYNEGLTNVVYPSICNKKEDCIYGVKNHDGLKIYSDLYNKDSVVATIPHDEKFTVSYYMVQGHGVSCYMVEYNGIVGWIDGNEEFYHYDENGNIKEDNVVTNPQQNIIGNLIEEDIEEDIEIETPKKEEKSINEKIIYYVVGTIVISLTAFVTILLVNKKRKLKNADK